ncbi:MAG TPA: hypothetical protein H9972_09390 [Candidatus Paraprevotella stercorigallinarum]|nr:hypothetical protein [Candidatus Paraprevotella stercorigallinarum]
MQHIVSEVRTFNAGRHAQSGYYAISVTTAYRHYYALWRVFTDGTPPLFIRTLTTAFQTSVGQAMYLLRYNHVMLTWLDNSYFIPYYGSTADVVSFGKYRNKRLAEVYYIDPMYVLWLANKFEPEKKKLRQLVDIARVFARIHPELSPPRQIRYQSQSEFVGQKGDKLENLNLKVLYVKYQVDTYKPDFYIDQRILAVDAAGCRYSFTEKAGGRSQTPKALSCHSRSFMVGQNLVLRSARVMAHYESHGVKYTRLGYVKYAD